MEIETTLKRLNLAIDLLQQVTQDCVTDTMILSKIEEGVETISQLCLQTDEEDEAISEFLSKASTVSSLGRVMLILKNGYNPKCWPALFALRTACTSLSDRFKGFCQQLCTSGFVTLLVKELKFYERMKLQDQSAEEYMVVSGLCMLENCAQAFNSLVNAVFWKTRAHNVILHYTNCHMLQIFVPALVLLGLMCLDADHGIAFLEQEKVILLLTQISSALENTELSVTLNYVKMSASRLLKGSSGLATNEANALLFVNCGVIPVLIKALTIARDLDCQSAAAEFLWILTAYSFAIEHLSTDLEVSKALGSIEALIPAAKCALQKIQGWSEKEEIESTIQYLNCAYKQGRYKECINICQSTMLALKTDSEKEKHSNIIRLLYGKSLYLSYVNKMKYSTGEESGSSVHKDESFADVENAIEVLGAVSDEGHIDDEGSRLLDLAMIDCIREINGLKKCKRCLLCHSRSDLKSSHVIPSFILAGFAKGLKMTASKKAYISFSGQDKHKLITSRQATWWMLCGTCELLLSGSGESSFAKEFFHRIYDTSDPSNPTKGQEISYSKWLYLFAAGVLFRGMAVNPKGISGFLNDDAIYNAFQTLRKIVRGSDDNALACDLKIGVFINPLSLSEEEQKVAFTLHRILNMPGFMHLMENEEKPDYHKIPSVANFFLAHLGMVNIVITFPGGDFVLPEKSCISASSGTLLIPAEEERWSSLPSPVYQSLVLCAQVIETQEIKVTQKRLDDLKMQDSARGPAKELEQVYGLSKAKQEDVNALHKVGIQPSSDPKYPKMFNLLPPGISVKRGELSGNELFLLPGHRLLLHQTFGTNENGSEGVTHFLCIGTNGEDYSTNRPYIIRHRFIPGLYLDYGFFVSPEDLRPEEPLPDKHPKFYAESLVGDLKSSTSFQDEFSSFLAKVDVTLPDLLELHSNNIHLSVKCIPQCWFCINKCDVCYTSTRNSLILYKQKFIYCSDSCKSKLVSTPQVLSALPEGYEVKYEFDGLRSVLLPDDHTVKAHITTEFIFGKEGNQSGELTMFFCQTNEDDQPYVICFMHSLVGQFSIGMYVSQTDFTPLELLADSKTADSHLCYIEPLYSSGIITMLLLSLFRKHNVDGIDKIVHSEANFHDKRCTPPCWYCKDKCINCFTKMPVDKEYCSIACQIAANEAAESSMTIFNSLPEGFEIIRSFKHNKSSVFKLPCGHRHLLHTKTNMNTKDGKVASELTIILCINEVDEVYILFQDYKPQKKCIANIALFISTDDYSIKGPMREDDFASHVFVDNLKSSPLYNIPIGIKEALRRRGFASMDTFLQSSKTRKMDVKCSSPCWFCEHRCIVCLEPTDTMTNVNGENLRLCSDECLLVVYQNPGIIHLLPPGYKVSNNPSGEKNEVQLPPGHQRLFHVTRDYKRDDGRHGSYTVILCTDSANPPNLYALYHQFNLIRQLTFGFYVSASNFEPEKPLENPDSQAQMKCLRYMDQLLSLEPIGQIIQSVLAKHDMAEFTVEKLKLHCKEEICAPPCWYCKT